MSARTLTIALLMLLIPATLVNFMAVLSISKLEDLDTVQARLDRHLDMAQARVELPNWQCRIYREQLDRIQERRKLYEAKTGRMTMIQKAEIAGDLHKLADRVDQARDMNTKDRSIAIFPFSWL